MTRSNNKLNDVHMLMGGVIYFLCLVISCEASAVVRCEQPGDLTGINIVGPPENLPERYEQLILQPKESGVDQNFGISLALQPPMLAVGQAENPLSGRGKVDLFQLDQKNWEIVESFDPPDPGPHDAFFTLALTEDFLAIGDWQWCPDDSSCDHGQIHLYERQLAEESGWKPATIIEGPVRFSEFGKSQAFDGGRLAFLSGIPDEGTPERVSRHSVLIYEHEEGNPEEWSVGAVNDQIFIGASEDDGDYQVPNNQAWLHWTLKQESSEWIPSEPLLIPSTCRMQYSYDGETLVFSWINEWEDEDTTALVFFEHTGSKWERVFELDTTEFLFDLSIDGDRLVVKAISDEVIGYVIGRSTDGTWAFQEKLVTDSPMAVRNSGEVELKEGNAAIGSTRSGPAEFKNRGTVFIYDLSSFRINPGLNDAWYSPTTAGQGFLMTVFPEIKQMFVAWFTFDTERPPEDVEAILGEPGHRWLTAQGPYDGDTANLTIFVTEGGVFDAAEPVAETDPAGDGTLTIEFADCTEGLVSYEITSLGISGEIPIQRISPDNVPLCESL